MNHNLEIISVGTYPAACCSCDKWGHTFTHKVGDTTQTKLAALELAHAEHVAGTKEGV